METESDSFELIIILALVAVFILFQLRRSLGKKGGYDPTQNQRDRQSQHSQPQNDDDNVVQMRPDPTPREVAANLGLNKSSPHYNIIEKIHSFDPSFNLRSFYDGAEYAYGVILSAFWEQDRKSLRSMLSREVYEQFDGAIEAQEQQKYHNENKVMDIEKIDLVRADLTGSLAELTVEFTSHMIMTTLDGDDKIISGDKDRTVRISDIWTFCRDVKSRDPNWTLVATKTG